MAKKNINKDVVKSLIAKNYYSWILNGENSADYVVSDSLSSLALDTGVPEVGSEVQDIKITNGSDNAKVGTIANGFTYAGAASTTYLAQKSLSVIGVDAKTIFGGAVLTTKSGNYTSPASKYTGTDVTVKGDANIYINNVKATSVYGGGAGYGSVLTDSVNITVDGTNKISNIYGGGQKGAIVKGDVNIVINRTGLGEAGKISNIYGGGDNATVLGNVNITINGVNSNKIGTVSGNGKGNKAKLGDDTVRTLTIADYAGDFAATIKEFDKVVFGAGTAVTLTKAQQNSMKSAEYEFIVDWDSTKNPTEAMLTWNKKVNAAAFYVTIDADFANTVDTAFQKTIFTSNQITADFIDKMHVRDEFGNDITSAYTLSFVAAEKNGKVQKKGGSIVLNYVGSKSELNAESGDTELTDAADKVSIKGDLVRASLDTKGGDDSVTVQTNTLMAGDIYLGEGVNTLNVQGGAEVTGSINVEKNSTNKINVNGTISQITGGDSTTNNIVTLRSDEAVGYYDYIIGGGVSGSISGSHDHVEGTGCSSCSSDTDIANAEVDVSFDTGSTYGKVANSFHAQDLDFTSSEGSNDTVLVTTAGTYRGNINFGKGADTLVLNTDVSGTITADDGNDVIVANKTGVKINAAALKLSGTDNVFVASNGVQARVDNAGAVGDFESQYDGIYLSQNALLQVGREVATMSYVGNLDLSQIATIDGRVADPDGNPANQYDAQAANLVILKVADPLDRVSEYYTAGDGVKGNINAAGNDITFRAGAKMDGTIYQDDTIVNNANYANNVRFMGTAGGAIYFNNDKATTTVQVDKGAVATVGSIDGLDGRTYDAQVNTFDADLAHVNFAGKNAAVYEKDGKNLIVGFTDKDIADFAETYGVAEIDQITVNGIMNGAVTFDNANVYTAAVSAFTPNGVGFNGDVNFVGANKVAVKTGGLVFDNEQMKFAEGATVDFTVLRDGVLVFDDIKAGEDYNHDIITVSFDQNARFAYGDTMKTKNWDTEFTANKLYTDTAADANPTMDVIRRKVEFVEGALLEGGIDLTGLTPGVEIKIDDNVLVKGKLVEEDAGAITLGNGADTLTIGKAEVNGKISAIAGGADTIELTGSTVNAMRAPLDNEAIRLDNNDTLNMKDGALVNGNVNGGAVVHVMDSEVKGSINGLENVLINAKIGSIKGATPTDTTNGSVAYVESKSLEERATTEIGAVNISEGAVALYADAADAKIGAIVSGVTPNNLSLMARNKGTVEIAAGIDATVGTANFTAAHQESVMKFGGDLTLVAGAADVDGDGNVLIQAVDGGSIEGLGNIKVNGGWDPRTDSLELLTGTTKAANNVSIQSIVTDANDPALGSNLKAGNVELIATTSDITVGVQDSKNEFGDIFQSGDIAYDGKDATGTSPYGSTTIRQATSATIAVNQAASFTAGKIEQHAATSSVTFNGTAKADGIAQIANNNATVRVAGTADVGSIDQTARNATVSFDGNDATLKGSIAQTATGNATVNANVDVENVYNTRRTTLSGAENDEIALPTLNSVIKGDIDQAGENANNFSGIVSVKGDGKYDRVNGLANPDVHKSAKVTIDEVVADYGKISQTGDANTVTAGFDFAAEGEADVTIGKASLTMGDVTQYSERERDGNRQRVVNDVDISLKVSSGRGRRDMEGSQSVLTLNGDVEADVGAIKQTAFKDDNRISLSTEIDAETVNVPDENKNPNKRYGVVEGDGKLSLEVASIGMRAYAGDNTLDLAGNVTVTGDVSVGGVLEESKLSEDSVWGDRVANTNTATIDVDTVTIGGDFSMIGQNNVLQLKNDSWKDVEGGLHMNAKSVYLAGNSNTVDIAYGVAIDNVTIESLKDADGIGLEGYELGTGNYTNAFVIRGFLGDGTKGYVSNYENANDKLYVYGGTVKGNVDTKNGNDEIYIGNAGLDADGITLDPKVMGDSKIDGNVVMGVQGAAEGTNLIKMQAFASENKTSDGEVVANDVAITGSVEMYAGATFNANGTVNTAASNTLEMNRNGAIFEGGIVKGSATIGGAVTMDAVSFNEDGVVDNQSTNTLNMGTLTKIGTDEVVGNVTMTAYNKNTVAVKASEEVVLETKVGDAEPVTDANYLGYAEITGKVAMSANQNEITVGGDAAAPNPIKGAAAYMNGISMDQVYTDADGEDYITSIAGVDRTNTIKVGTKAGDVTPGGMVTFRDVGSELIVGTNDDADKLAAVTMGTVEFAKAGAAGANYVLDSVEIAEKGHDIYKYLNEVQADVKAITKENTIDVTGRFSSANITMFAERNSISLAGDGELAKYQGVANADKIKVAEDVRTASFVAGDINQQGAGYNGATVATNSVSAVIGNAVVDRFTADEDGNVTKTDELAAATFKSGAITQARVDLDENTVTNNAVTLTGNITATTGAIDQSGNGTNAVTVDGFLKQYATADVIAEVQDARSTVDSISQATSKAANEDVNTVTLTNVEVAGSITQTALEAGNDVNVSGTILPVSYVTYDRDNGGDQIRQYNKSYAEKVGGDITQTGAYNKAALFQTTLDGTLNQIGARVADKDGNLSTTAGNAFAAVANVTNGAKVIAKGEEPVWAGKNHDAESILAQGDFNTQSIGAIVQSFNNTADVDGKNGALNSATVANANVGSVNQTGEGLVTNVYIQAGTKELNPLAVEKLGNYVGEKTDAKEDVNKVATYNDIAATTVGKVEQSGTGNGIALFGVQQTKDATIDQTSVQFSNTEVGGNDVSLNGSNAVTENYVEVMTYGDDGTEAVELAKLDGSANKFIKTSVGAITQTSNAQKNFAKADFTTLAALNTIESLDGSAVDINGKVTQKVADDVDGVEARFANVQNSIVLGAQAINKADLRIQTNAKGVETYAETVISTIDGAVEQKGFTNTADVTGVITGNVDQTANMLASFGHPDDVPASQSVADKANNLTVTGVKNDEVTSVKKGDEPVEIVRAEELIKGSVGNVTQIVDTTGADLAKLGEADFLAAKTGDNTAIFNDANFGDVKQESVLGDNTITAEQKLTTGNGVTTVSNGGAIDQDGLTNSATLKGVAGKTVDQTAVSLAKGDDKAVYSASNTLTTDGYIAGYKKATDDKGNESIESENVPAYTTLGDVVQTATGVKKEFSTTIGEGEEAVTAKKDYFAAADTVSNSADLTATTVGNVTQTAVGVGTNDFKFTGKQLVTHKVVTEEGKADKVVDNDPVFENTIGAIKQTGMANKIDKGAKGILNAKSVASIEQTANAVDTWASIDDATKIELTTQIGDNFARVENVGEITGTVTQTMNNVAFSKITKTVETDKDEVTATDYTAGKNQFNALNSNVVGLISQINNGLNTSNFIDVYSNEDKIQKVVYEDHDSEKSKDATKDNPDVIVKNAAFLGVIGDVRQEITNSTEKKGKSAVSNETAFTLAETVVNRAQIQRTNAGVVTQIANGYATNVFTSTDNMVLPDMKIENYARKDADPVKAVVKKIDQSGFVNKIDATNLAIGSISVEAKVVEYAYDQKKTDGKIEEVTGKSYGSNTITLNGVDVGGPISATDNGREKTVGEGKDAKTFIVEAGKTTISLLNGTTVNGNITTGVGSDSITLTGKEGSLTKVVGMIDMGDEQYTEDGAALFNNGDVITVNAYVDLSKADIKNVENFQIAADVTEVTVKSLQAENVEFLAGKMTGTLYVGESLTLGGLVENTVAAVKATDDAKKVEFTFNDDITGGNFYGSATKVEGAKLATEGDKVTINDNITDLDFYDVEYVDFTNKDIDVTRVNWHQTAENDNKIAFNFKLDDNQFAIGKIDGYAANEISFNGYTTESKATDLTAVTWAKIGDDKVYRYADGMLTYAKA